MIKKLLVLPALFLVFVASPAYAEIVSSIKINGNQRIEEETIKSFLGINAGDSVSDESINAALAAVYETGLFADVTIDVESGVVVVNVVENPIIGEVAFEGNKRIEDEDLSKEITLAPRAVYTKAVLQQDVKRILDLYQKSGRFSASVEPKVIELDQNRVNIVFEVDEGDRAKVEKISFVGNSAFSDAKLTAALQTKESRWYRFFTSDDTYDPDRLAFDQELLRRFYTARGYADFKVLSANAELTPDKESFFITFTIDEGRPYVFGGMAVESELPDLKVEDMNQLVKTMPGDTFNAELIEKSMDEFTKYLGNLGYAFVSIDPQYERNQEAGTVGIKYMVKEGPRVYIENINIAGNVRTLDKVVRREFRIAEGDPYNADKIKRSQQRIKNLKFFKNAEVKNERGSADDKVDINVDVEEQSTGELTFGAGFSSSDGAIGDISISERNLLGKGQFLKLNFTLASIRQDIDLSFTEPYFMDQEIAAGFDLFKTKREGNSSRTNRTFDTDALGGTMRASYALTEHLSHSLRYSYRSDEITNVLPTASLFVRRQEGENTTSLVGHSFIYDTRDSLVETTEGYFVRFNQDVAGLGGDARFFRNEVRSGYFHPVFDNNKVIFKAALKGGHILGLDSEDIRINDRFFVGSNEIRGFASEGIGPRDETTKDPLGGNIYFASTLETSFPVGLPDELGVSGSVFTDFGTLYDVDDKDTLNADGSISRVLDESSIRASLGVGVAWNSPFGPVRVDLAKPYMDEEFDETEVLKFSFGTRF